MPSHEEQKERARQEAEHHSKHSRVDGQEMSDEEVLKSTNTGKFAFWNDPKTKEGMDERRRYMKQHSEHFNKE
jgi:hypothetical protein